MAEKDKHPQPVQFFAYLPPIQTALTISGDGDLLRIKLDVNLKHSPDAVRLLTMTGKRLEVSLRESLTLLDAEDKKGLSDEAEKETKRGSSKVDRRRRTNRRDQR